MRNPTFIFILSASIAASAIAGPVDSAIVAAMKIPDAPNYSWRTDVVDDSRTYEITGATDRATDYSLVTMPMTSTASTASRRGGAGGARGSSGNVTTVLFKGSEHFVVQTDDGWRKPDEMPNASERGGARRGGGIYGGAPGIGGPRGRSSRGSGRGGESGAGSGYSNLQNTLSRPHEEISVIVAGATDMKVDGDVVSGTLPETTAQLLLVHDGQKNIEPKRASGTFRMWIQNGVLVKYETTLDGVLSIDGSSGRRDVTVHQTSTTTLTQVGTTKVEVPAEAKKKLGA